MEDSLFSDIFIHLPVSNLKKLLPTFINNRWQPELALQTSDLDQIDANELGHLRSKLNSAQLRSTLHAPFFDLNPASGDAEIKAITARRFNQTIDFALFLGSTRIVFHPGYDPWRYARNPDSWLQNSLHFWPELVNKAENSGILLCLENIFDTQPTPLVELLRSIESPNLRHCFDIGHWHLFSKTPLQEWFSELGPYLSHLHLHDNRGRSDDHRPIGQGKIDFRSFIEKMRHIENSPTVTLEAHNNEDAERSLKALHRLLQK